jgi:hypothetical protein
MSNSIAITRTSLLCLLTIEFYIIAYIYTLLNKLILSISLASRVAYEIISYLVTKRVAYIEYLCVIILIFYISVSDLLLRARIEGYKSFVFSLVYSV